MVPSFKYLTVVLFSLVYIVSWLKFDKYNYYKLIDELTLTVFEIGSRIFSDFAAFCLVQVVPSIAIAFVTYEMVKDVLGVEIRISD